MTLTTIALVLSAVALGDAGEDSRTADAAPSSVPQPKPVPRALAAVREHCPDAVKAITYYRHAYTRTREAMNLRGAVPRVWYQQCASLRERATAWRTKAKAARLKLAEWHRYQYAWQEWLPRGWANIGRCETGLNWQHNSGTYQGSFGFARTSWDAFVPSADPKAGPYPPEAYDATPRQQYEVALAIYRRFGLSGWGCRAAFTW